MLWSKLFQPAPPLRGVAILAPPQSVRYPAKQCAKDFLVARARWRLLHAASHTADVEKSMPLIDRAFRALSDYNTFHEFSRRILFCWKAFLS
jgi:hypothetical protein